MENTQISFHGYRDAVKFFVAVPGQPFSKTSQDEQRSTELASSASPFGDVLVVSGGDGYVDLRLRNMTADTNEETSDENKHLSYLMVWHLGSA